MAVYTNYCSSGSKASRYALRLTVNQVSQDKVNNKSTISYILELAGASYFGLSVDYTGSSFYGYTCNGSITIKNATTGTTLVTATGSSNGKVSSSCAITIASGTATIPHNSDGTLTLNITGSFSGGVSSQASAGSVSGETTLTKIARASSISATDGDIESTISIYINRADDTFTHTLTYSFGGLTGTIATKTNQTSLGFTIPSSFYAKIPNAKEGTCTITCTTYSGDTSIGTSTCSFQAKTNETKCKPTISNLTIVDTLSTATGSTSILVNHVSKPKVTATFGAKNSATLSSYIVKCGDGQTISASSTSTSLNVTFSNAITNNTFTISVTDSRGYTTETSKTITWTDYIPLTINPTFSRVTPTGGQVKLVYEGKYYNGKFNSTANTLTIKYRYKVSTATSYGSWVTLSPTISGNTYNQTITLSETYTYTNAYDFEIIAIDKINTSGISKIKNITQGIPIYWWNKTTFNVEGKSYISDKNLGALTLTRSGSTNASAILFKNSNGNLGYIGMSGSANGRLQRWNKDASSSYEVIDRSIVDNYSSIGSLMGLTSWTGSTNVITRNTIAHWDGSYESTNHTSNLTYAKQGVIQCKPTQLYYNASGTTGGLTLSQTSANFNYLDIYYYYSVSGSFHYNCTRLYTPNGKVANLMIAWKYDSAGSTQITRKGVLISGTSLTVSNYSACNCDVAGNTWAGNENTIYITKIDGWK